MRGFWIGTVRTREVLLSGAATMAMLIPLATAQAQTAPAPSQPPEASKDEVNLNDIVVTGTLIRGVAPTGSSLVSVTPAEIKKSGATDPREILATVPLLSNFGQSQRAGAAGANSGAFRASIHNLGPGATLTLINGHRVAPSGTLSTQVDPNSIPSLALERVEILANGGSAIYGSDAVAGVLNFITRKDYDGVLANVRYGTADSYHSWDAGLLAGKRWETGSAMIAYQYTSNTSLNGFDRPDFVAENLTPYGGSDNRSAFCQSPNIKIGTTTYAYPGLAAGTNKCEKTRYSDLLYASERHSVYGTVRQELGDAIKLWAEGSFSERKTHGHVTPYDLTVALPNSNPFFVPVPGAPASSETVTFSADNIVSRDAMVSRSENPQYFLTGGGTFKVAGDWKVAAFVTYGHSRVKAPEANQLNPTALSAAASATTVGAALDPFGGRTSSAVVDRLLDWTYLTDTTQTQLQGSVQADGTLFNLPGGPAKLAVGAEARRETFKATFIVGPAGAAPSAQIDRDRKITSLFGELYVPLVGPDNALPIAQEINLSFSGRYDHYSDFGSTTNPKIALDWVVVRGLKLRGNWGKSYHAPSMSDLYAIDSKFQSVGAAGQRVFGPSPVGAQYNSYFIAGGNPNLKPETAKTWSIGADIKPVALEGFHANITYYNIDYMNVIQIPMPLNQYFSNPAFAKYVFVGVPDSGLATFSAGLPIVTTAPPTAGLPNIVFDLRRNNVAQVKTDGLDLDVGYKMVTSLGTFELGFTGNHVLGFSQASAPGIAAVDQLSFGALPKWRTRSSLSFTSGAFSAATFMNYNGKYESVASGNISYTMPAVTTFDFFTSYEIPGPGALGGTELTVNLLNAFNTKPPVTIGGVRTDTNVVGRLLWLGSGPIDWDALM